MQQQPGAKTETLSHKITEESKRICKIVSNNTSNRDSSLNNASIKVSPMLVLEVFKRLSNAGVLALSFFRWTEKQKGFKHVA
ncbi:hypothetical protein Pint_17774 [Pistacia integerrima]|uniref:Uncharacterized protein n=1 Tax=Pistacia integerrima TaxID=434235 RepID=A0ACC0Z1U8_9ROSI|nr:hypothetical protein Pint_17774 [Pistacia integerrima]